MPERSLGELFGALTDDLKHLVQQEARLAKAEMNVKLALIAKNLGLLAVGAGVLYGGFLLALFALTALLVQMAMLQAWQAAAAVSIGALVLGGATTAAGVSALKNLSLKPEQTITTLKEDAKWLKQQAGKT